MDIPHRQRDICRIDNHMERIQEPSETDGDVLDLLKGAAFGKYTKVSSHVNSIDTALDLGGRGCEFESHQFQCSCEN